MPSTLTRVVPQSTLDSEIFLRLWDREKLTPTLARHLLKLGFSREDEKRMDELAAKNQDGEITAAEVAELDNFVRVGAVLSILQSRARKFLRQNSASRNGSD